MYRKNKVTEQIIYNQDNHLVKFNIHIIEQCLNSEKLLV